MMLWREKELRLWVSTGELCRKSKLNCLVSNSKAVHRESELCLAFSKQEMRQYFNDTFSWKLPSGNEKP